jgi:hypothetical protein
MVSAELETKKIMRNAILKYAETYKNEVKNTQIRIYTSDNECNPKYNILNEFKDLENNEITLKQLMLVPKVDFTGKGLKASLFVEPKIKSILKGLSKSEDKDPKIVSVIVATNDNQCIDLRLILCIENKPLKLISFKEIFGE